MAEGDSVVFFDQDTMEEGEITFRNGQFIEVETESGETRYPDPWDIQRVR
jgi:hypothetical protein